jgi:DNA repair photolyase
MENVMTRSIYQGATGTKEWAGSNVNFLNGCQHGCKYCYAKAMVPRHGSMNIEDWGTPEIKPGMLEKGFRKRSERIMFPSVHDIHPDNLDDTIAILKRILEPGNDVLIVSKPHRKCIKRLCSELSIYKKKILFRFSIGSSRNAVLKFWEPNAPLFAERLASLKFAHQKGFSTSVSCEPMLDNKIHEVVKKVEPFVSDTIWIGKINNAMRYCKINGHGDAKTIAAIRQLEEWQSPENIFKLYKRYKRHPKIMWKGSIRKVLGQSGK